MAIVPGFDTTWVRPWVIDELADHTLTARPPRGLWVFTDLERYGATQIAYARLLVGSMRRRPDRYRILNDPRRTRRRLQLLQELHAHGINDFRAWPVSHVPADARFPLLVRRADDHKSAPGDLCATRADLRKRRRTLAEGDRHEDWIAVEFAAWQRQDGRYRKFGAFVVGGAVIPRHLFVGDVWCVKSQSAALDEADRRREIEYLMSNEYATELASVARLAGVEYGRIDFDERPDGGVRVWEINTNPVIRSFHYDTEQHRAWVNDRGAQHLVSALRALEPRRGDPGPPLPEEFERWVRLLRKTRPGAPASDELPEYRARRDRVAAKMGRLTPTPGS